MKRLIVLTLMVILVGAMGCGKDSTREIIGPTEYDTTTVFDSTIVYDTTIVVDTIIIPDALDYYHALQLWINTRLTSEGLDSYYPTVNTYDIVINVNSPTQMTIDIWWPAFNFTVDERWYYYGVFIVVYNGPGNWQVINITSNSSSALANRSSPQLPTRTLR